VFNESLHRRPKGRTGDRNSGRVWLADIHPAAPAEVPGGSFLGWLLLALVLAVVVAAGVFLTSRR
jgi:hypothetical protein